MQKKNKKKNTYIYIYIVSARFLFPLSTHKTPVHADGLFCIIVLFIGSHITLQPKTGCPLKLSRVEPGQYLDGRPPEKTRLLLEEGVSEASRGCSPCGLCGSYHPSIVMGTLYCQQAPSSG